MAERPGSSAPLARAAAWLAEHDRGVTLALFLLALGPRLFVAFALAREPVWDGHYYDFGARRIAEGHGYSDDVMVGGVKVWHPWCHYPVGYSAFLGGLYALFGSGPKVAVVANAVLGALTAALAHRLARACLSTTRARVAGLLVALSPGLLLYTAVVMTEVLSGFLLVAAVLAAAKAREGREGRWLALAGVVVGLATLVRPQSIVLAPALALFWWHEQALERGVSLARRLGAAAKVAGLVTAIALAVVTPWTVRNCRVMDGCAFVSTNAGWNLAIGSFPRATGRFETLRPGDGCPEVRGQVHQDRCWANEGKQHIARDPVRWLGLAPKKLGFTFDHESFPVGYLGEADPSRWPEPRRATARHVLSYTHRALLGLSPLAFVGLPSLARLRARSPRELARALAVALTVGLVVLGVAHEQHPFWPLALLTVALALGPLAPRSARGRPAALDLAAFTLASLAVTHVVFFGEDRYHMVATPMLALLAASALRRDDSDGPRDAAT